MATTAGGPRLRAAASAAAAAAAACHAAGAAARALGCLAESAALIAAGGVLGGFAPGAGLGQGAGGRGPRRRHPASPGGTRWCGTGRPAAFAACGGSRPQELCRTCRLRCWRQLSQVRRRRDQEAATWRTETCRTADQNLRRNKHHGRSVHNWHRRRRAVWFRGEHTATIIGGRGNRACSPACWRSGCGPCVSRASYSPTSARPKPSIPGGSGADSAG